MEEIAIEKDFLFLRRSQKKKLLFHNYVQNYTTRNNHVRTTSNREEELFTYIITIEPTVTNTMSQEVLNKD